ncbi:arylesterase [Sphingobacterium hungaricum]
MIKLTSYLNLLVVALFFTSCNSGGSGTTTNSDGNNTTDSTSKESAIKNILFFGNSLTAGYGLETQEEAFPALIQQKIDSLKLPYQCINAGLSGETSAGGNERIDWLLKQPIDVFFLELGANDGLRGLSVNSTYENLKGIIDKVLAAYPDCKLVLAGMKVPPNMGNQYFKDFETIYPRLAKEYNMALVPFLLENVAGLANLNQEDGVHPTTEGQIILADNVWPVLQPLL